ncbi:MAG: FtsW/RodA/SpoVE family cell cycle protein [Bacteroidaceae bacterium]|nr:FtsW/RodA/SpoVE family cell cycle protein [Bacteroidaceae bacterium]MBR0243486.1 FtsW/RodA/SpoVE family cell cycle protein [Bacteroidaceae bacterium]
MTLRNKTINASSLFEGDKVIWMILFFLCIVSVLEVYSASSTMTFNKGAYWTPVLKHGLFLGVGVSVAWGTHKIPQRYFGYIAVLGIFFSVAFLLVTMLRGQTTNDAARWMDLGFFSFQPSELAKGSLVMLSAVLLSYFRDENGATSTAFKWVLGITCVICALIVTENLSTAALTFLIILLMMFIAQVPWKYLGSLLGILSIAAALGYSALRFTPDSILDKFEDTPLERVKTWSHRLRNHVDFPDDPKQFDLNTNPQITQSHIAIATCNIIGRGPGNSRVRDFLPQAYSDFIYAIIIEELGLFGGFVVMFLYIILLFRAAQIASRSDSMMLGFMVLGLALLIVTQALINMAVAVGVMPVTGQPLPLVSRGGSSIMVNCFYIGLMLNISRSASQKEQEYALEATKA